MTMRQPRQKSEKHLEFVRKLQCVICERPHESEAAHIRMACEAIGKRSVGMGERPDDAWTLSLCNTHHREQHEMGESAFWVKYERDPFYIALALWKASGNEELGARIARQAGR